MLAHKQWEYNCRATVDMDIFFHWKSSWYCKEG